MINANKTFKSQIRKVNYADITLRDGTVLNLEPSDFILGGFSMTDETTTGKFGVGSAVGKTISLTIANHTNKFSMYDFYKSIIYMYVSVTLEDGTVLKERKGKYYVINPTSPGDVIVLSGVDSMHLFDKPYNASTAYPATLQSILSDCCLDCGVNIGFRQFDNYDFIIQNKPEECTYRQVVSWVAQIAGYNARISNNDYLELVWYDTSILNQNILDGGKFFDYIEEDTYDGGDFTNYTDTILWDCGNFTDPFPENVTRIKSINVSTDDVVITGVKVEYDNDSFLAGEEGYCITLSDNEFVAGKQAEIARYLGDRLIGLRFRPLSCQIPNNPLFEPFDSVYVYDRKGNAYFTFINSVTYSISGFTTISCKAEDPIRNESHYVSKEAQAVVRARKEAKEELSSYDKAVQNMNMLAANAMGLFRDYEEKTDGSVIYYMSNRPITKNENGICEFALNSVVYKMTGDGFFVSEDGGKSYTGGFDANMNAVVNVLSAIGITFDWAKGGTLTLGGKDNVNGVLTVLDKSGNIVGKFNKDGLWAKNGYFEGDIKSTNAEITGGYINIETNNAEYSAINLHYGNYSVSFSPILLKMGGDAGVQINKDYICVGSTGSIYSWVEKGSFIATNGTFSSKLSYEGITLINSDFYLQGGDIDVSGANLEIHSGNIGSYGIDTSRNVRFTGVNYINGTTYIGSTSYDSLEVKATAKFTGNTTLEGAATFKKQADFENNVNITGTFQTKGTTKLCDATYDTLGFFGGSGSSKQTVSTITLTSSATTSSNASKINEIINALKKYNLL